MFSIFTANARYYEIIFINFLNVFQSVKLFLTNFFLTLHTDLFVGEYE